MTRLAALALAFATPALAQPASPNAEILAVAHAFDDAQLHGDRAALERLIAPDYLIVHASGKVGDRRDFIEGFAAAGHTLQPFAIVDPLFIRVTGDVAIVGGETTFRGTEDGQPFVSRFRYADTFVRREGRWLALFTQVTPLPAP